MRPENRRDRDGVSAGEKNMKTLIAASVALAAMMGTAAAQETIKVGALYNLTGGMSSLDGPSLKGAQLAVKQINAAGGLLG